MYKTTLSYNIIFFCGGCVCLLCILSLILCFIRDVKRGQNVETETEDTSSRPMSRLWPGIRGQGQDHRSKAK